MTLHVTVPPHNPAAVSSDGASRHARIDELDGWRAISVALVIISHLQHYSSIASEHPVASAIGAYGELGVQIFFVLSGFVICRGLLAEIRASKRVSLTAFYIRRTFRIFPVLFLYLATVWLLVQFGLIDPRSSLAVTGLTFTCNLGADCGGYLGGHFWSLSVEEQFYLFFPAMFAALGVFRRHMVTLVALILPLLVIYLYVIDFTLLANFLSGFIAINIGVLAALNEERLLRFARAVPSVAFWLALAGPFIIVRLPDTLLTMAVDRIMLAPLIATFLIMSFARPNAAQPLLTSEPMRIVGRVSYGLYIWQQLATYPYEGAGVLFYAGAITLCGATVYLSYRFIEEPLMGWAARLSSAIKARDGRKQRDIVEA